MRRRAGAMVFLLLLAGGALAYFGGIRLPEILLPADEERAALPRSPAVPPGDAKSPEAGVIEALGPRPAGDGEPKFDIARIDPSGVSVFAGRAAPNAVVTVLENGKAVGSVKADENGEWAMSAEYKFATADPNLTLRAESAETAAATAGTLRAPASGPSPAREARASGPATARLMENLEELVESARRDAARPPAAPAEAKAVPPDERGRVAEIAPSSAKPRAAPAGQLAAGDGQRAGGTARPGAIAAAPSAEPKSARSAAAPWSAASIPIPITFVYREATFTEDGRRAVELLREYLELKRSPTVSLSGHADEIGGPVYNMALSKERLDAVARFLRDGGFRGKLDLIPKGETEPFTGIDRTRLAVDEVRQLDRRVELRLAQ